MPLALLPLLAEMAGNAALVAGVVLGAVVAVYAIKQTRRALR